MTPEETSARALARLRTAVERTAGALASADLDALLGCEIDIESALVGLPRPGRAPAALQADIRAEVEGARAALLRCRRLGAGLSEFIRLSLDAQGIGSGYGRAVAAAPGRTLDERF